MKSALLAERDGLRTFVVVMSSGDEALTSLAVDLAHEFDAVARERGMSATELGSVGCGDGGSDEDDAHFNDAAFVAQCDAWRAGLPGIVRRDRPDVVVLLLPFTEQTRGLLGEEFLAGMKDGALLVNASRGGVLDTDALVRHLQQGRITAALDVVDPEPLPEGHPLWKVPGLLLTPHVAGSTSTIMARCYATVRTQLDRYVRGEPLQNVIVDGY